MVGGYIVKGMLNLKLPSRRKRGRPQSRFMFVEEDDIHRDRVTDVTGMG